MRGVLGIVAVFACLLLIFGCAGPEASAPQPEPQAPAAVSQPEPVPLETPAPTAGNAQNGSKTAPRDGHVNLNEIGGEGLNVMSVWKLNASVAPDGKFTTEVSTVGAQLVWVVDKNGEVRATAVSLPEDNTLVFDAESTTKASLWVGGSATQEEGEQALGIIESLKCYPAMYSYMLANLKQKSLTKISNFSNSEYMDLQMNCGKEIVALIDAQMGIPEDSLISQSKSYWRGAAPFAILEHGIQASSGNATLVIQNMDARGTMTINSISFTTGSATKTVSAKMAFKPGELRTYYADIGLPGETGKIYELQVSINYVDPDGKQKMQSGGSHALVGRYLNYTIARS